MTTTFRDRVASYLRERAYEWVDGLEIARVGGVYASRTRISECRRQLGMTIENRVVRQPGGSARSLYRYVPPSKPSQREFGI